MKKEDFVDIDTNVWTERGGEILKEKILQEAHVLHSLHQVPATLEAWQKKKAEIRKKVFELAGVFPETNLPLDVKIYGEIRLKGYKILKLSYQSRKNLRVTGNLFVPDGKGPFPGILNVHGHYHQGKIAGNVNVRGAVYALEGFVTLSIDAAGAGERGTYPGQFEHHRFAGLPLLAIGESLMSVQIVDNMRGIDLLQSLSYVDASRIGVTGASGGGNQTMWISALDSRVKAAVPVVSTGTFEAYVTRGNCWCETLFDGLKVTEEWGILGLIAPNPLLILTANLEKLHAFMPHEMLRTYKELRKVYSLYGAQDNLTYHIIDLPHGYFPEMLRSSLGWFKYWLKNEGSALPKTTPEYKVLPEEDFLCFKNGKRPAEVKSLIEYVSIRSDEKKKDFLTLKTLNIKNKKAELAKIIRLPDGPDYYRITDVIKSKECGHEIWKFTVESEIGFMVPCTLIYPEGKFSSIVIAASQEGKKELIKNELTAGLLEDKKAVCLADLRNTGETRWAHVDDKDELYASRALAWIGRSSIGEWVKDFHAVHAVLNKLIPEADIEVMGFNEVAVAALIASGLKKSFTKVHLVDLISSYVQKNELPVQRDTIWIPGILCWGDVTLMAAMTDSELEIKSLMYPSGKYLSKKEFAGWQKEVKYLRLKLGKKA